MTPIDLPIALVNLKDGLSHGEHLDLLPNIMKPCAELAPAIIVINEARWHIPRYRAAREAVRILSELCGCRYEIEIGEIDRSDNPPALVWDTNRLRLATWSDARSDPHKWGRNTAHFRTDDGGGLRVIMAHWDYASSMRRLMEAQTVACQIKPDVPTLVAGDLNSTASGAHLPSRDWTKVPAAKRHGKGRQLPNGGFTTATESVDTLIGVWDHTSESRVGGAGLRALAELDWYQRGCPAGGVAPTTYSDQSLLIDWLMASPHVGLVPDTYRVWDGDPTETDHKLVTATIRLNPS